VHRCRYSQKPGNNIAGSVKPSWMRMRLKLNAAASSGENGYRPHSTGHGGRDARMQASENGQNAPETLRMQAYQYLARVVYEADARP